MKSNERFNDLSFFLLGWILTLLSLVAALSVVTLVVVENAPYAGR